MTSSTIAIVISIVAALGTLLVQLTSARKSEVDRLRAIIETMDAAAEEREEYWQRKYTELEAKYEDLCEFVRSLGYDPVTKQEREEV
jgi:hypothetical protein